MKCGTIHVVDLKVIKDIEMKKGFTLSESLITLAIIGVISAILIPLLNNVRPDKDRVLYKKAMYAMQNAVSSAVNDVSSNATNSDAYWADENVKPTDFCSNIANQMNIVGGTNCSVPGDADAPNFTTTNGAKWWGLGNKTFTADKTDPTNSSALVYVDVNGNGGDNADKVDRLKMRVWYDGQVTTDSTSDWNTENGYLKDSIKFNK